MLNNSSDLLKNLADPNQYTFSPNNNEMFIDAINKAINDMLYIAENPDQLPQIFDTVKNLTNVLAKAAKGDFR